MTNKAFLELAEKNKDQIIEKLEQAFVESIDNRVCDYLVELYNDEYIDIWYRPAGSNTFLESNWNGNSVTVAVFNHLYMDIEESEDMTEEEYLDWYKDEYKQQEAEEKYYHFIEEQEQRENITF